jgi:F0F1-type ATP synthase membrane subunit c/vacuolar-type H+-ATPase subunit K
MKIVAFISPLLVGLTLPGHALAQGLAADSSLLQQAVQAATQRY